MEEYKMEYSEFEHLVDLADNILEWGNTSPECLRAAKAISDFVNPDVKEQDKLAAMYKAINLWQMQWKPERYGLEDIALIMSEYLNEERDVNTLDIEEVGARIAKEIYHQKVVDNSVSK